MLADGPLFWKESPRREPALLVDFYFDAVRMFENWLSQSPWQIPPDKRPPPMYTTPSGFSTNWIMTHRGGLKYLLLTIFFACLPFFALTQGPFILFFFLQSMDRHGCRKLVFSSSATVYGSAPIPYTESSQVGIGITNPYGRCAYASCSCFASSVSRFGMVLFAERVGQKWCSLEFGTFLGGNQR